MENDKTKKQRALTGDRPTGALHLGHYVGSLESRIKMQEEFDLFVMIADIQALTDNHSNPEKVSSNILQLYRDYYSIGIDPQKVTIFIQSMIPEISELTVLFANLITLNEVLRNPTVKTEIEQKNFGDSPPFGFIAYPVSQAADILFCKSLKVPVGEDQAPMIELARKIARRFNKTYKKEVFPLPQAIMGKVKRLPGIDGNAKMGKSLGNTINLNDSEEDLKRKVKSMYTDPNRVRATDPGTVEGNPVFIYHDAFNLDIAEVEDLKDRYTKGTVGDVEVKDKLFIALNKFFETVRERRSIVDQRSDNDLIEELRNSTETVRVVARDTMSEVRETMGINYFS